MIQTLLLVALGGVFTPSSAASPAGRLGEEDTIILQHRSFREDTLQQPRMLRRSSITTRSDAKPGLPDRKLISYLGDLEPHRICDRINVCSPGTFQGKHWHCSSDKKKSLGEFCFGGWKECEPYANPRKFNGEWWVCPRNRNLATGNRCDSGWITFSEWNDLVSNPEKCPPEEDGST